MLTYNFVMPPRYLPDVPFPPYSYVPGVGVPHPIRDPAGHSHGKPELPVAKPESPDWRDCRAFLWGVDLFNAGYFWEAHEAWEQVWHACGHQGRDADFFKGLIKLAAAGVKAKEGNLAGIHRHARRAEELFSSVLSELSSEPNRQATTTTSQRLFGIELPEIIERAHQIAQTKELSAGLAALAVLQPDD